MSGWTASDEAYVVEARARSGELAGVLMRRGRGWELGAATLLSLADGEPTEERFRGVVQGCGFDPDEEVAAVRRSVEALPIAQDPQPRPRACVAVIVIDAAERILLGRRKKAPNKGMWSLPAGGIERGETWAQAAAREVLEEAGIVVTIVPDQTPVIVEAVEHGTVLIVVRAVARGTPEPVGHSDLLEPTWFRFDALPPTADISWVSVEAIKRTPLPRPSYIPMGGVPCVKGTRISVACLVSCRRCGWNDATILEQYPTLSQEALDAAWAYAAAHPEEFTRDEEPVPSGGSPRRQGLNRVMLLGSVVTDPESYTTKAGQAVLELYVRTVTEHHAADGIQRQRVSEVFVTVTGKRAEALRHVLRAGARVFVEGELRARQGVTEVVATGVLMAGEGGADPMPPAPTPLRGTLHTRPASAGAPEELVLHRPGGEEVLRLERQVVEGAPFLVAHVHRTRSGSPIEVGAALREWAGESIELRPDPSAGR